jgi:hypothetical protein
MQTCPRCSAHYLPNTLFCESCGAPLHARQDSTPLTGQSMDRESGPLRSVSLEITDSGRVIEAQLTPAPIVLGRADAHGESELSLDLTADGGLENGVSRRHARLLLKGADLLIEDLHSANGTWVNDARLSANQPFPLKHGDLIRLGRLRLRVNLLAGYA